jgi:hypothetical protein
MRGPTPERTLDLLLRGAGGGSIAFLLFDWYTILTASHVPRDALLLLPLAAFLGAMIGGVLGLFIWLYEYAFQRTTGVMVRSLIGAYYVLMLGLATLSPEDALSLALSIEGMAIIILIGVLPALYAGMHQSLSANGYR